MAGHVPAFSTADQMMEAGYDEMTHINQFMLQWVLGPTDDTRTLLRLTALKQLPALDLNSPRVQHSIDMIAARKSKSGVLGFIGGMDIPLIHKFEVGYEEGARAANPRAAGALRWTSVL